MSKIRDKYDYVGWIPCISGHLVFEFTDCGLSTSESEIYSEINHFEFDADTKEDRRYIIVSSCVNWKDGETALDGKYRVVLLISAPIMVDQLEGHVCIIPFNNKEWESNIIEEKLLEIRRLTLADNDIKTEFLDLKSKLDCIPINGKFIVDFLLFRSGFIFLRHGNKSSQAIPETSFILARQSYYYIKNTFHRHAHHHKSAESLTTTYYLPEENTAIGMILVNDLKRSLVTLKRNLRASAYSQLPQVKGIISYAKSLLVSSKKEGFITTNDYEAEKLYIENLGESLDVSASKIANKLAAEEKASSNFRAIILFVFTVIAPITLIFREEIKEIIGQHRPTIIMEIISHIAQSDLIIFIFGGITFASYFLYRIFVNKFGSIALAIGELHGIIESIVFTKRRATVIICTLLALSLFLFYAALRSLQ